MKPVRVLILVAVLSASSFGLMACGSGGDGIATPSDPVLAQGQTVYRQKCASCHGSTGGGGTGTRLAGNVAGRYPDIDDQIAVIVNGRAGMPAFGKQLSAEDIEAVARYEREVL